MRSQLHFISDLCFGRLFRSIADQELSRGARQCALLWAIGSCCMPLACFAQQKDPTAPKTEITSTGRVVTAPTDVAAPSADAQINPSGLGMKVLQPGSGTEHPASNDCVSVSFIAWKTDGTLFSTSTTMNDSDVLCLNEAIMGVAEALKDMVVGEKRRLWIPEDLTFHEGHHHAQRRPEDEEPPHKDLTFDLTLLSILKAPPTPVDLKQAPAAAIRTASGLAYQVLSQGKGDAHPAANNEVMVHFSGWRIDGRLFESTIMANHPALVTIATAPSGFREALQTMRVGEKARFWIPSALAFGDKPADRFNPAGDLVYEIELLSVQ
jgi:FKBP-type peptidyl-prolyl cis-trans isomerase